MAKNLIKKIQNFAFQNELWKKEDKIVVGVSGGPDSMCLLDIFLKLKEKYSFGIIIAHVNYGLRGKDSELDEKLVKELAKKNSIRFECLRHSKILKFNFRKNNSEDELRNIRYQFFEKVRRANNLGLIAVAHNEDDQAETFLMRIIRGAGLSGMASMRPKSGNIIRPLLQTSRSEVIEYLKFQKIKYRIDRSNLDQKYLRNRIRHSLIPYLEKKFNPNVKKLMAKNAAQAAIDYEYISKKINPQPTAGNVMEITNLLTLHPAEQNKQIRDWIKNFKGDLKNITAAHINEIKKVIKSAKNKNQIIIIKNLKLIRKGDKLTILWKK